jgi:hypothetical protein
MSVAQATNAVLTALNAWKAVTSVQFRFEGFQTFGQGADTVAINDDKLRIQLHDTYNSTGGGNTLGVGGRNASSSPLPGIGWNIGGNVAGTEFWRTRRGYVVLNSANVAMQNLSTFTEVLCHEIGHAINLAHSSENPSESDPVLKQAIMYYQAHADGRGAALGSYDVPVIQQIYPTNNTPPFTFSRVMDIVMAAPQPASPINTIDLRGYDLQSNTLTLIMTNVTAGNGDFSKAGSFIHFTPRFFFVDSERLDPGDPASAFDRFDARYSDGTNASPYISVRVISFSGDDDSPSDGIPDNWMLTYFGHADPRANDLTLATSDKDGDRLTNLQEYRAGMDPTSAASAQKITLFNTGLLQVQVKPYELYELHGTTNFVNWIRVGSPFIPTNAIGSVSNFIDPTFSRRFYRVYKVQ